MALTVAEHTVKDLEKSALILTCIFCEELKATLGDPRLKEKKEKENIFGSNPILKFNHFLRLLDTF